MTPHMFELGDIVSVERHAATEEECRTLPFVGLEDIEGHTGEFSDSFRRAPEALLATKYRFETSHVLYGKLRPNLNKVVNPSFRGVCTTEVLPLRPRAGVLDRDYLHALLLSKRFVRWATSRVSGANLPRLDPSTLLEFRAAVPPLERQAQIAAHIKRARHLRQVQRYASKMSDGLLGAVFREMFGDPWAHKNSCEWLPVDDIVDGVTVGHVGETSSHYRRAGVPFLRTQNVRPMRISRLDLRFVTTQFAQSNSKALLRTGDVLVSRVGANRGMAAVVPDDLEGASCANVLIVRPGKRIVAEYLAFLVNSSVGQRELLGESVGSAQGVINTSRLAAWRIPIVPLEAQRSFGKILRSGDGLYEILDESRRQAEHLFQSLLHEAFGEG